MSEDLRGVHPRSRGEYSTSRNPANRRKGSSPLTRGILPCKITRIWALRFIPAHAGNTAHCYLVVASRQVHPRSRGEYNYIKEMTGVGIGSSPLTRGIPFRVIVAGVPPGFIPAHAGNTSIVLRWIRAIEVHPRSRGEYSVLLRMYSYHQGSSPLTRGILLNHSVQIAYVRFIPAHAGNTPLSPFRQFIDKVHPRSRGEYTWKI